MKEKRKLLKANIDSRIKLTSWLLRIMILVLIGLVAYDAWVYKTPLYYMVFALLGALVGSLYSRIYSVKRNTEKGKFTLRSNYLSIVMTLFLIIFKVFLEKDVVQTLGIIRLDDAVYLYYIGLRWSKLRVIYNQIENEAIGLVRKHLQITRDTDT
jgi:H+/Cl- antiporter ClcA